MTRSQPLEHEFLAPGNVQQGEILRRRTHENQIVVLNVVEREQAPALHANAPVKQSKHLIEGMNGQYFAHAGIVIKDQIPLIPGRIVVAHSRLWPTNESRVTENDPGLFWAGGKGTPESSKNGGSRLEVTRQCWRADLRVETNTAIATSEAANKIDATTNAASQFLEVRCAGASSASCRNEPPECIRVPAER